MTQKRLKMLGRRVALKLHGYPLQPAACRKAQTCLTHVADEEPDLDDEGFVVRAAALLESGWKPKRGGKRRR